MGSRSPDKWFRLIVVLSEIFLDGCNEFFNSGKVAPTNALLSKFTKPTLDQIEPGRAGRCVMNMKARMLRQPGGDIVMFMGA